MAITLANTVSSDSKHSSPLYVVDMYSQGLHPGKECGFDTDIRIPLIVRGPGIAAGQMYQRATSHTDISPTIMELAGQTRDDFDGAAIPLSSDGALNTSGRHEHINIEYWGAAIPEGEWGWYGNGGHENAHKTAFRNNTYKGLRIVGDEHSLYYSTWCSGQHELYDLKVCMIRNQYGCALNGYRMIRTRWITYTNQI